MIVVTAATGQFGHLAVEGMLRRNVPADRIAVAVRNPDKAADLAARGVEVRRADYDDPKLLRTAFSGAEKLLLVSSDAPDDIRIEQHRNAVAAAADAGIGLVAYTSLVAADSNPLSPAVVHRDAEQALAEAGLPSVLLRNNWYTENYTDTLPDAVLRGVIVGCAGEGRIASATRADLAEAAAVTLIDDGHAGKVYELTGQTAWSFADLAVEATKHSGKSVVYQSVTPDELKSILIDAGLPLEFVEFLSDTESKIAHGALAATTDDLANLLGRPPTPLTDTVAATLR